MEEAFPILLNRKHIGRALVSKEGLYCKISCICDLPDARPWRVSLGSVDLGVCLQKDTGCHLKTKLPLKVIREQPMVFRAFLPETEMFWPLDPDLPFEQLDRLQYMAFRHKGGQPGLIIM